MDRITNEFISDNNVRVLFGKLKTRMREEMKFNLNDPFIDALLEVMKRVLEMSIPSIKNTTASVDKIVLFLNKKTYDLAYDYLKQQCNQSDIEEKESDKVMDMRMARQQMQRNVFPNENSSIIPKQLISINTKENNYKDEQPDEILKKIKKDRINDKIARVTVRHEPIGNVSNRPIVEKLSRNEDTLELELENDEDELEKYIKNINSKTESRKEKEEKIGNNKIQQNLVDMNMRKKLYKSTLMLIIRNSSSVEMTFPYNNNMLDSITLTCANLCQCSSNEIESEGNEEIIYICVKELDKYIKGSSSLITNDSKCQPRNACGAYSMCKKSLLFAPHQNKLVYNSDVAKNNPWLTFTLQLFNSDWQPFAVKSGNIVFEIGYIE